MSKIVNNIFIIRPTNEENNEFIITVGRHLATKKRFKTEEEAEKYLKEHHWDTILSLTAEMIDLLANAIEKPTMINQGINKTKKK